MFDIPEMQGKQYAAQISHSTNIFSNQPSNQMTNLG
jgi:hypothetical protein